MFIGIYNNLVRVLYPVVIRRYIEKRKKIGKEECISSVLEYYGYTVIVVTNYEDAINVLC